MTRGGHSVEALARMLVRKNVENGSDFGPLASTTSQEKRVLFHGDLRRSGFQFEIIFDVQGHILGLC